MIIAVKAKERTVNQMTKLVCDICKKEIPSLGFFCCKYINFGNRPDCCLDVCHDCGNKIMSNSREAMNAAANAINNIINKPESEESNNANSTE